MKENSQLSQSQPLGRIRPEPRWHITLHWVLAILQAAMAVIQVIELAIFDSHLAYYMPTISEPDKSNWVQWQYDVFVCMAPAVLQFTILPTLMLLSLNRQYRKHWRVVLCVAAIGLALFIWFNAIIATSYKVGTFD